MKYKDYLLIPILAMYILYASCAYIAENGGIGSKEPVASVCPTEICWDSDSWYADGARGGNSFNVENSGELVISDGRQSSNVNYSIADMHMRCSDGEGTRYDLIFLDEMTAYDCISGTYYQRGDYESLMNQLSSGRFVNEANEDDYYVFKDSGRSTEYLGNRVFKGEWTLSTAQKLTIYDNQCDGFMDFNLIYDNSGKISGLTYNNMKYSLEV